MTAMPWKTAVSGDWSTAADWGIDTIPTAADDVLIAVAGNDTLTVRGPEAANSISLMDSGAVLQVGASSSVASAFTATAGTIAVSSGQTLSLAGAVTLDTSVAGSFAETVTLSASGANASGYFGALPTEKLTIEGLLACYLRGTHVATPTGERCVETRRIGDLVTTVSGSSEPIRWVGRRSYHGRFIVGNRNILPVCIHAGALADGVPRRDLWVSPLHAMFVDDVLVPAVELVNGVTLVQAETVERTEYVQIEMARHDVVLAEGAASESFVDDDCRMMFQNAHDYAALYPNAGREPALYCAPRVTGGFALDAIRNRLSMRAGLQQAVEAEPLCGPVECVETRLVDGGAQNLLRPGVPVCLDVLVNGVLIEKTLANRHRPDCGTHGFSVPLSVPLTPLQMRQVTVRRSSDHAILARESNLMRAA